MLQIISEKQIGDVCVNLLSIHDNFAGAEHFRLNPFVLWRFQKAFFEQSLVLFNECDAQHCLYKKEVTLLAGSEFVIILFNVIY